MKAFKKLKNKIGSTIKRSKKEDGEEERASEDNEEIGLIPTPSERVESSVSAPVTPPRPMPMPPTPTTPLPATPALLSKSGSFAALSRVASERALTNENTPSSGVRAPKMMAPKGRKMPLTGSIKLGSPAKGPKKSLVFSKLPPGVKPPQQLTKLSSSQTIHSVPSSARNSFAASGVFQGTAGPQRSGSAVSMGKSPAKRMVKLSAPPSNAVVVDFPQMRSGRGSVDLSSEINFTGSFVRTSPKPMKRPPSKKAMSKKTLMGKKVMVSPSPKKVVSPRPPVQHVQEDINSLSSLVLETASPVTINEEIPIELSLSFSSNDNTATAAPETTTSPQPNPALPSRPVSPEIGRSPSIISKGSSVALKVVPGSAEVSPTKSRAPSAKPVSKEVRNRIIEQFSSLLSPHQYYGKLIKITNVQSVEGRRVALTEHREKCRIYVATKDSEQDAMYYPQLRLLESDAMSAQSHSSTVKETPITVYEAYIKNMLFASQLSEGRHLLEGASSAGANSCFVTESSSIVFRDEEKDVFPVAKLCLRWIPFSSPQTEPQCPIHKKEMQLFDPFSKKFACALCASKQPESLNKLVVIPDVLTPPSRVNIVESLRRQHDESKRVSTMWVKQHGRVSRMSSSKHKAINQQFDLLVAAVEAKRQEFLEACTAEFDVALTDISKEILTTSERLEVLSAASTHLESTGTLNSLQIAAISEALEASKIFPSRFSKKSLKVPALSSGVMPKLEGVMAAVHSLSPGGGEQNSRRIPGMIDLKQPIIRVTDALASPQLGAGVPDTRSINHQKSIIRSFPKTNELNVDLPKRSSSASSLPTRLRAAHRRSRSNSFNDSSKAERPTRAPSSSVPNSSGTALFDYPVHQVLSRIRIPHSAEKVVEWSFTVLDYGEWAGIGVGVGLNINEFVRAATNDLSHLWIVPFGVEGASYTLRVTEKNGHAKLSVHDRRGRRLDDGNIPQWNAQRPCYPQATFGGRVGHVELLEAPHAVNS